MLEPKHLSSQVFVWACSDMTKIGLWTEGSLWLNIKVHVMSQCGCLILTQLSASLWSCRLTSSKKMSTKTMCLFFLSHLPDHPEHQDGHVEWCQRGGGLRQQPAKDAPPLPQPAKTFLNSDICVTPPTLPHPDPHQQCFICVNVMCSRRWPSHAVSVACAVVHVLSVYLCVTCSHWLHLISPNGGVWGGHSPVCELHHCLIQVCVSILFQNAS